MPPFHRNMYIIQQPNQRNMTLKAWHATNGIQFRRHIPNVHIFSMQLIKRLKCKQFINKIKYIFPYNELQRVMCVQCKHVSHINNAYYEYQNTNANNNKCKL